MAGVSISGIVIRALSVGLSLFLLYTAYWGTFYPFVQRAVPLTIATVLVFLTIRARPGPLDRPIPIYDWILAGASVVAFGYVAYYSDYLSERWPMSRATPPSQLEIVLAIVAVLLLMETVRRTIGWALVVVIALMLAYTFFGDHLPWQMFRLPEFNFIHVIDNYYLTVDGIWGSALGIAATYVALFVIFGAFMEKGGANEFFMDVANAIAGESRGGPAKVSIFSSAMVGSVTGSTVANVYTTGQLSIPLMKRIGYRPSFAGAVEALASNGGQLMPPIMGAAAFLVAANANVSYITVAVGGIIPALIYFGALFWFIHLEAVKRGLQGLPKGTAPKLGQVMLKRGHLMVPLALLIVLLADGFSPLRSGFYAIVSMVALSWLRKDTRIGPREFVEALETGARNSLMIIVVCAAVGIVIGTFLYTGLGLSISNAFIRISGNNFLLLLPMITLTALILGTGMNTVAAFLLVSIAAVPAITSHGVDLLTANMFVFYLSLLSMITPPVCLAVFAAASVARANVWETAFVAVKLGVVAYLLPFIAVFSPGIFLTGTTQEIVIDSASSLVAAFFLVCTVQNRLFAAMPVALRLLMGAGAIGLLWPTVTVMLAGLAACCLATLIGFALHLRERRSRAEPAAR